MSVLATVKQAQISVADPKSRVPVKYQQGAEVELTQADFERLLAAGAVEASDGKTRTADVEVTEDDNGDDDAADLERRTGLYAKLTHDKLDQAGRKAGVKFAKGATRQEKAQALAEAEVAS